MKRRGRSSVRRRRRRERARGRVLRVGCASAPQPVTKIVNGRVVGHARGQPRGVRTRRARACCYEQDERWKEAADELQRALPFDPEAAEVRAHLAELFIRLGRLDDAAEQIARSLQIAPTVDGLAGAGAPGRGVRRRRAPRAGDPGAARGGARWRSTTTTAESIERTHLELAEAQVVGARPRRRRSDTARELVDALRRTRCAAACQLAVLAWATGALDEAAAALAGAIELEPNDVEARLLLGELQVATNKIAGREGQLPRGAIDRAESPMEVADAFAGWLVLRGEVAEAQELADRLIADAGDADTLAAASALERTVKRPDRAVALAERAVEAGPRRPGRRALLMGAAALRADDKRGRGRRLPGRRRARRERSSMRGCAPPRSCASRGSSTRRSARSTTRRRGVAGDTPRGRRAAHRLAIARSQVDEKRGDAARAARRLDEALGKDGDAQGDARLMLARAAVDERRGDWQRAIARAERAAGAQTAQRRGAELRRLRRRRSRPRPAARDQAAAGGGRAVAGLGRDHRQPRAGRISTPAIWRAPTSTWSRRGASSRATRRCCEHLGDLVREAPGARPRAGDLPARARLQAERSRRARARRSHPDAGSEERGRPMRRCGVGSRRTG